MTTQLMCNVPSCALLKTTRRCRLTTPHVPPGPPVFAAGGSYRPWAGALLWPPLTDLDLPVFGRFLYDHSPCRPDGLSRLLQSSLAMQLPAAAVAAARPSGFKVHETEAAWISESAAVHHGGVRWSRGRQRWVDSCKMAANATQIGLRKPTSSRRQHALMLPRLLHTPP